MNSSENVWEVSCLFGGATCPIWPVWWIIQIVCYCIHNTFNQVFQNRGIVACIIFAIFYGLSVLQQCIKYSFIFPGEVITSSLGFSGALPSLSWVLQRQLNWDIPNLICPVKLRVRLENAFIWKAFLCPKTEGVPNMAILQG